MPANKKHLNKSGWNRFARIAAGFLGGFFLTTTFHLVLALWIDRPNVLITSAFTGFILWAGLFIVAFLIKKARHVWSLYLGLILIFSAILYFYQVTPVTQ